MDSNYCSSDLGQIWIVWDPSMSVLVFSRTDQLMLCSIKIPNILQSFAVTFVYGRNTEVGKRLLWDDIRRLSSTSPLCNTPWLLVGDFNQIASVTEHYSVLPSNLSLRGFEDLQECLRDSNLVDLPSRGVLFTWSNHQQSNPIVRKLDRAIVDNNWLSLFPNTSAIFYPHGDSNHAPCMVMMNSQPSPSKKKSFKYFSFRSSHPEFLSSMELNRKRFSNIQRRTSESLAFVEDIQSQLLLTPSDSLFREEHVARKKWKFFAAALESFYKQKSRIKWLKEGDANTRFFHRVVIAHHAKNLIKFLKGEDGVRVDNVDKVKGMIVDYYYSDLLGSDGNHTTPYSVDRINGLHPFRCDDALKQQLVAIPSEEEIIQSLFSMPKNKALGLDGFPGHLLRRFNTTAITLIPKVLGANMLPQFRLVASCHTIYKLITRLISRRLKLFISQAVQSNQVGFIKGRLLCENVLLAFELVDNFHIEGETSRDSLQIDLSKAYDNVNWEFLLNILVALDLPSIFVSWIKVCISTPSYNVAFNGELIGFFNGKKGIRQGDLMSSHLFVLVMDIMSKSHDKGVVNGLFQLHPRCVAPLITHLSFADDVLVFFDGAESSIAGIMAILDDFKAGSGFGINREKTALLIDGGNSSRTMELADRFGLKQGSLHVSDGDDDGVDFLRRLRQTAKIREELSGRE
ncbi:hypothetical protein AXX17_AT5G31500 [Arabidopsis thaliana]|uniref:Reverse transcriptase domain-containing protein n=1 Tax=Arabidopsis thaliana TaxID=3702 RepID=A0A178UDM0_ARATH|nr:hypothetical protein AXX17_AT5G31500 [Arabidopsis thaliana]